MKKSFLQRLQKVKIKDLLSIFLFIIAIIPALILKIFKKPFWLICDCEKEARDNGFAFFKYMAKEHPNDDFYFAIDFYCDDFVKICDIDSTRVIDFGSLKHWIYYLACEKNIISQKNGKPNAAICYILEVFGPFRHKGVFLQHGIICNDLPYVHYENAKFGLFTTSTEKEYNYVKDNFNYPDGFVKKLGLTRFDYLIDKSKEFDNKYILVMPTWRQWISNSDFKNKDLEDISDFTNTEYFKAWNNFLSSEELHRMLEIYDKTLIFYPHRKMQDFVSYFSKIDNKRIIIANDKNFDVQELLNECSFLITDYSSVSMDFAYLNKPLTYYQFDYDMFRKNHLTEGYFSYEKDGFGKVVYTEEDLFLELETNLLNNLRIQNKYENRINSFFDLRDNKNCERTYNAIKNIK